MPASPLGKVKMVAQVVAILLLILGQDHLREFFVLGQIALWIAVIAALVSARRLLPALQRRAAAVQKVPDAGRRAGAARAAGAERRARY